MAGRGTVSREGVVMACGPSRCPCRPTGAGTLRQRGANRARGVRSGRTSPAGPAAAAPCAPAGSGCRTRGSASGSACAPSPPRPAGPPAGPHSAPCWPSGPAPAAVRCTAWPPAPGFSEWPDHTDSRRSQTGGQSRPAPWPGPCSPGQHSPGRGPAGGQQPRRGGEGAVPSPAHISESAS